MNTNANDDKTIGNKIDERIESYQQKIAKLEASVQDTTDESKENITHAIAKAKSALSDWKNASQDTWEEMKGKTDQIMEKLQEAVDIAKK